VVTSKNFTICENTNIDANISRYGVITSPNYPTWSAGRNCVRNIVAPVGKVIRVFISDLNIENPDANGEYEEFISLFFFQNLILFLSCQTGYLSLKTDCGNLKYCGTKDSAGSYILESCSNTLTVDYVSTTSSIPLRGFNIYFEVTNPG
jgi:hypothetical protein